MAQNDLLSERRGQTLILTFNRPEQSNALTTDMAGALFATLKNATTDRSVRAVLLRGAGGHFMNGLDMSFYTKDINAALDRANDLILPYHSAIREMQAMDKPVLAVAQGQVSGVGLSLMLAADLVLSSRSATFNAGFVDFGLSPDGAASYFLPRKVGLGRAMEILMLGEPFSADRAERLRIVNKVVDDAQLEEEALIWLEKLAQGPTKAYGAIKKLANKAFEQDLNAHLSLEHTYFGQTSRSFDFREGVRAHAAGREKKFTGT